MKKLIVISILIHLGVVLFVGYVVCPWAQRTLPAKSALIDVLPIEIGDEQNHSNKLKSKGSTSVKKPDPVAENQKQNTTPAEQQIIPLSNSASQGSAEDGLFELADGSGNKMTAEDYRKWVATHNTPPDYPRISRIRGEEGRVVVRVEVPQSGSPSHEVFLESSSGFQNLDEMALQKIRQWTFPAFRGASSTLTLKIPFQFRLKD